MGQENESKTEIPNRECSSIQAFSKSFVCWPCKGKAAAVLQILFNLGSTMFKPKSP